MQVTKMERFSSRPPFSREDRRGWSAVVKMDDDSTVSLTRYDDETAWLADSYIGANGYPFFVHGEGERCIAKRAAAEDMAALLDEARETARFRHMKGK